LPGSERGFDFIGLGRAGREKGRPSISREVREWIQKMSRANPFWGAPRLNGELQKLGINISQATSSEVHGATSSQGHHGYGRKNRARFR
jgi:hypothetical protein